MAFTLPTNLSTVEAYVGALYGYAVGSSTMTQINSDIVSFGGLNNTLNAYYSAAFGTQTTANVAKTIVANVGLGSDANAIAYVTGQLNSVSPSARGAAVASILNGFAGMTADSTYGSAAIAWNATVAASVTYAGSNASDATISTAKTSGQTSTLTFNATTPTFTSGLNIGSGSGSILILNDGASSGTPVVSVPGGTTINVGTLTINGSASDSVTIDTTLPGWSQLSSLNVYNNGAQTITAGTSSVSSISNANGAVTINGGSSVTSTAYSNDNGSAVLSAPVAIGATSSPTGQVTLNSTDVIGTLHSAPKTITISGGSGVTVNSTVNTGITLSAGVAGQIATQDVAGNINVTNTPTTPGPVVINSATNITGNSKTVVADLITVTGGSSVNVTQTATQSSSVTSLSSITMGAVNITGDSSTTSVTVTQPTKSNTTNLNDHVITIAIPAVFGVNGNSGVAAGPGTNYVPASTQTTTATSTTGYNLSTPTVTADGAVTINDKNYNNNLAGTISTVTLSNYGNSTIASNAISTINLSGSAGTLGITNNNYATTPLTALTINVNGLVYDGANSTNDKITINNNYVTTLNIVSGATNSSIKAAAAMSTVAIADDGLINVNISGAAGVVTIGAFSVNPQTITVTGAAGYTGYLSGTSTSLDASATSGKITTFVGGSDLTKSYKGGSNSSNELIFSASGSTYFGTGKTTASNISGFSVLGVTGAATTWDWSKLPSSFNAVDIQNGSTYAAASTSAAYSFTNVPNATAFTLVDNLTTGSITVGTNDTTGTTDSITLNIASSTNTANKTLGTLSVADANSIGIGTININANGKNNASVVSGYHTISTLTDGALSNLNIAGNYGLVITNAISNGSTQFTINNASTMWPASVVAGTAPNSSVTLGGLSNDSLGNITFAGSGSTTISTITDAAANITINSTSNSLAQISTLDTDNGGAGTGNTKLTFTGTGAIDVRTYNTLQATVVISNSGTGTVTVGDGGSTGFTDNSLTSLTLNGNVAFGTNSTSSMTAFGSTGAAVTVNGATDNAHVSIALKAAAASTSVHTITLGNGNNFIKDLTVLAPVSITTGTGYNNIDVSTSGDNATYLANITLGSHSTTSTSYNNISVGITGTQTEKYSTVINGINVGDKITFAGDAAQLVVKTLTSAQANSIAALATYTDAIAAGFTYATGAGHEVIAVPFGGNTYLINNVDSGGSDTAFDHNVDTIVKIAGTHTVSFDATGVVVIAS